MTEVWKYPLADLYANLPGWAQEAGKRAADVIAPGPPPVPDGSISYRRWQVYSAIPRILEAWAEDRERLKRVVELLRDYVRVYPNNSGRTIKLLREHGMESE